LKRKTKTVLAKAHDAAIIRLVNTSTHNTSATRDAGQKTQITVRDATGNRIGPGDPDYDMMKAKQESRERRAAAHLGLLTTPAHTLKSLLALTGHHCQPYGGGFQVFHEPGATGGDPRYWSLADAHVVGLLSGPSLHIITKATVAALAGKGDK
jgi:hypothetical protein